jgi:hypothetical protein
MCTARQSMPHNLEAESLGFAPAFDMRILGRHDPIQTRPVRGARPQGNT